MLNLPPKKVSFVEMDNELEANIKPYVKKNKTKTKTTLDNSPKNKR